MFEWNNRYSVQIGSIDAQHQTLFRLAEELHTAMSAGQGKSVLSRTLDRLVQYTMVHFVSVAPSEGAIMAAPEGARAPRVDGSEGARAGRLCAPLFRGRPP